MSGGFGVHACFLNEECRQMGVPRRVYLNTPWGTLIVGERTQGWLPFYGVVPLSWGTWGWWPVVWHPSRSRRRPF